MREHKSSQAIIWIIPVLIRIYIFPIKKIRTVENGQNLEECLRFRGADLVGILNGIDEEAWDPLTDASIPRPIDPSAPSMGKKKCKESILKEFKLSFPNKPLLGVVSRLYEQKGLDLLLSALPEILKSTDATFIILGSGAENQENGFLDMAKTNPEKIAVKIGFDDALARRIFAGSDFFLMPSRFEPCGLAQQYAMRYGSVSCIDGKTCLRHFSLRIFDHLSLVKNSTSELMVFQ